MDCLKGDFVRVLKNDFRNNNSSTKKIEKKKEENKSRPYETHFNVSHNLPITP